jgi:hypothetical protein
MKLNPIKVFLFVAVVLLIQDCIGSVVGQAQLQLPKLLPATETAGQLSATDEARKRNPHKGSLMVLETRPKIVEESERSKESDISNVSESADRAAVTPASQGGTTDEWQFQLTPYLWIAGITGKAGIGDLTVDIDSGITDSDVHLNFGFMGTFEARKNRLVLLTDLQYSNLGTERPTPGPLFSSATADFKTFILDPEVGYRVADNPAKGRFVDVLGGIRYWHLSTDLNFAAGLLPARSATASRDWVDAVLGVRGRMHLSPRLFLTGKADLGGGGSKFTFQLLGGVGFQISKRFVLIGGYRDLDVNYDRRDFLFDTALHGPIFGFGIKF